MQVTKRRRAPATHPQADEISQLISDRLQVLSPAELLDTAQTVGVHRNTLYTLMKRRSRPTLDSACALLHHFGLPLAVREG